MIKSKTDNNFIKSDEESLKRYIKRIFQRYFEIENVGVRISREAMITEVIRRYKEYYNTKTSSYVMSINNLAGILYLSAYELDGESFINKKSAFNKDFGIESGTICEGNDERLSNARQPLQHFHTVDEIISLDEALTHYRSIRQDYLSHTHKNLNILDKIRYTGVNSKIDLKDIEPFKELAKLYIENIKDIDIALQERKATLLNTINPLPDIPEDRYNTLNEKFEEYINWPQVSLNHAQFKIKEWIWENVDWFSNVYVEIEEWEQKLPSEEIQKALKLFFQTTIDIDLSTMTSGGWVLFKDGVPSFTDFIRYYQEENLKDSTKYSSISSKLIDNTLNDKMIRLFFRWKDDNNEIRECPLPYVQSLTEAYVLYVDAIIDMTNYKVKIICSIRGTRPWTTPLGNDLYAVDAVEGKINAHVFNIDSDNYKAQNIDEIMEKYSSKLHTITANEIETLQDKLNGDKYYIIDGIYENGNFIDSNGNIINKSIYEPYMQKNMNITNGDRLVYYNKSDDYYTVNEGELTVINIGNLDNIYGYIAEYQPKTLTQYFNEPQVYMQVFESERPVISNITMSGHIYDADTGVPL